MKNHCVCLEVYGCGRIFPPSLRAEVLLSRRDDRVSFQEEVRYSVTALLGWGLRAGEKSEE